MVGHGGALNKKSGEWQVFNRTMLWSYDGNGSLGRNRWCHACRDEGTHQAQNNFDIVWYISSSTAQGGGGSFKNRKPIGEVGCCESRMAERSHWWIERWLMSPLFLSFFFSDYLPTYLLSLSLFLSVCLSAYLSSYLSNYLSIYLSVYLATYLSSNLSIYLSIYLSFYLSSLQSISSVYLNMYLSISPSTYLAVSLSHLI